MAGLFLLIVAVLLAAILISLLMPFVLDAMTTCCLFLYYKKRDKDLRKAAKQRVEAAQSLMPPELLPETREFRRWQALGEAYTGLVEIASGTEARAKGIAKEYIKRIKIYCYAPRDPRSEP